MVRGGCALCLLLWTLSGCVTGGGMSAGAYVTTRGDVGAQVRGHATALGFRLSDRPDEEPAGAPLLGVELGAAFSFLDPLWHLQVGVPLGAGTWDDLKDEHGVRVSPQFVMDYSFRYGSSSGVNEAYGGGLSTAYLRHLQAEGEAYDGPDAFRIHRMGPVLLATFTHDDEGWLGSFFLGAMWDYEAYVASGR